jgi:transcriptional regulator
MPRRREFLKSELLAALPLGAASAAESAETIYIPERHRETDRAFLESFFADYSFAMLITAHGGLHVTNVPTLYEPRPGGWGKIWWHLAKSNAHNSALAQAPEATFVFHGPHSYISPNWYETKNAVPTWNFAVVHATGKPQRLDDDAHFAAQLAKLVARNEARYAPGETKWKLEALPDSYLKGMRQGIVAYELAIESVEAKFKLGHERNPADRAGVLAALESGKGAEPSLAQLTARYYQRAPKP